MNRRFSEYEQLEDKELIWLIHQKDDFALDFLMNKYKRLVEKKSSSYFLIGASREDLIQEGMIGLFKAIRDYNSQREASFYSFAELCITRQMITAVKASTRQKHMPLNTYVSLNRPTFQEDDDSQELINFVPSDKILNPEELLIGKENFHLMEAELLKNLSKLEKRVFKLHVEGIGYKEIGQMLNRSPKSIDNSLQRIKKKLERIMSS